MDRRQTREDPTEFGALGNRSKAALIYGPVNEIDRSPERLVRWCSSRWFTIDQLR